MNAHTVSQTVLAGIVVIAVIATFVVADMPVSRRRVDVFAARQRLNITEGNGAQVIAYLAVTRRWRSAGLVGALTGYVVLGLRHHSIGINIAYALSGWFLGAVIAEIRINGLVAVRQAASLQRRTLDRFLPSAFRTLLAAAALACLTLAGIAAATGYVGFGRTLGVWFAAGIGLPTVVALVARRILLRPQPYASADMLLADEAIRRRSLRVITAGAITLLLYCVAGQVELLLVRLDSNVIAVLVILLSVIALPVAGRRLAG